MAMLPRYQRLGVNAAQPRELDFANLREGVKQSQTISDVVGQMSDFVYKKAAASAERQGQEAVRDQGAQTVLGRIAKGGGPKNIAERAAYDLGSRIASAEIQTEAEVEIARILDQAQKNKTPFGSVSAQLRDVTDGYSAAMSNIDPEAATVLRTNIASGSMKSAQRYASWYDAQMAAATAERNANNVDILKNSALTQAGTADLRTVMTPNGPMNPMSDILSSLQSSMENMGYGESDIARESEALKKQIYREQVFFQFYNTDSLDGKREIVSELYKKPLPGYTLEQTTSLASKLEGDMNALVKTEKDAISSAINEGVSYAYATGEAPTIDEEKILNIFGAAEGSKIIASYKDTTDFAATVAGVATSSIEHLKNVVEKLNAEIKKPGNTDSDVKKMDAFLNAVTVRDRAIKEDAAAYVLENNNILQRTYQNAQQNPASAQYFIASMDQAYDAMGVHALFRNYLPKSDASAIVAQLNSMPLEEAPVALSMILGTYGDNAQKISAELSKAGLAPEYSVAMRYSDNTSLMAEIVASKAITLDDLKSGRSSNDTIADKEMMNSISDLSRPYRGALTDGDLTGAANRSFAESYAIAEKIARLRLINNNGDPLAVAQSVFVQMFPHQVVKTIGGGLGQNYLLPQDIDGRMAENALRVMMSPDLLRNSIAPIDDPRYRAAVDIELDIVDLNKSGVWINNSTGDGVVLTYRFRDQIPLPVIKPDGTYYEVKFADMQSIAPQIDAAVLAQQEIDLMSPGSSAPTIEQQYQQYLFPAGTN